MIEFTLWDIVRNLLLALRWTVALSAIAFIGGGLVGGLLLTLEGSGTDARAQVNFGRHGTKWLALSVAKLTPTD